MGDVVELKKNPFLHGTTPRFARPNPFLTQRNPVRRRNPFRLPSGLVGKLSQNMLGAGAYYALDRAISLTGLPASHPRLTLGIVGGIAAASPLLSSHFPRLGPAFGGAAYYALLNPLYESRVKAGIFASVAEAVGA
jgi:hypothetical protein